MSESLRTTIFYQLADDFLSTSWLETLQQYIYNAQTLHAPLRALRPQQNYKRSTEIHVNTSEELSNMISRRWRLHQVSYAHCNICQTNGESIGNTIWNLTRTQLQTITIGFCSITLRVLRVSSNDSITMLLFVGRATLSATDPSTCLPFFMVSYE